MHWTPSKDLAMVQHRFHKLDVVRGIAAFIVVLNHVYDLTPGKAWHGWTMDYTPFSHLVNGRVAVIIFFVLSGFVLTIPYVRNPDTPYPLFVFRRFCRIYLPFAVALILAATLAYLIAFPKPQWALNDTDWGTPIDFKLMLSHFLMTGVGYSSVSLNPPMWTLIQEMRMSLIFPLMAFLIVRFSWKSLAIAFVLSIISTKAPIIVGQAFDDKASSSLLTSAMLSIYYSYFFCIGIFLASNLQSAVTFMHKIPRFVHVVIIAGFIFAPKAIVERSFLLGDVVYALVAAYIIICCVAFPLRTSFLDKPILRWSGKVSYSMYLVHLPIILALIYLLHDRVSVFVILGLSILLTLPASEAFYRLVEQPAMRLGRFQFKRPGDAGQPLPVTDS